MLIHEQFVIDLAGEGNGGKKTPQFHSTQLSLSPFPPPEESLGHVHGDEQRVTGSGVDRPSLGLSSLPTHFRQKARLSSMGRS